MTEFVEHKNPPLTDLIRQVAADKNERQEWTEHLIVVMTKAMREAAAGEPNTTKDRQDRQNRRDQLASPNAMRRM